VAEHPSSEHVSCQQVVELVTDYVERALPADQTALFEQHLNFCDGCVWYVDQIRTTIASVGRIEEEDIPPETRERLLAAFRDWNRS
jgi:anti-sigma factor RsiW